MAWPGCATTTATRLLNRLAEYICDSAWRLAPGAILGPTPPAAAHSACELDSPGLLRDRESWLSLLRGNSAMTTADRLVREIWTQSAGSAAAVPEYRIQGEGSLPSVFAVSDLAAASVAAAGLAVSELMTACHGGAFPVCVDRRLSSLWFGSSIRPLGWSVPAPWDSIAGDYRTEDGWIRLHTNAPHHKAAALAVLDAPEQREAVARAVAGWSAAALEAAVIARGGCAAEMRSLDTWRAHDQGRAVASEPLFHLRRPGSAHPSAWVPSKERPLRGVRVLDLTRVLAGPVATRFLAGWGADVLRIDPPGWDEPGVVPEVTLGKRCARLDLREPAQRERFERLLAETDIVVHGYRPGALDRLGLGAERRQFLRPGLIDVSLDAYGWTGPWSGRRGFDSLVQMSAGIADQGMRQGGRDRPTPLPVQALDHATGYLLAAIAVRGLTERLKHGTAFEARTSLARVAALLTSESAPAGDRFADETPADWTASIERTEWGTARRVSPPVTVNGVVPKWDRPATSLGSAAAEWLPRN